MMKQLLQRIGVQILELLKNKFSYFKKALQGFFLIVAVSACAVTATRPTQEMSNADAALRAAKDINADSLVPELYRSASESFHNAKREYRLKNFEVAKTHAIRSTKLAEQAEFEAFKLGGATPETSLNQETQEGALPEGEVQFQEIEKPREKPKPTRSEDSQKPKEAGIDYQEYLKQQEAEGKKQEASSKDYGKEDKDSEKPKVDVEKMLKGEEKPEGPQGPTNYLLADNIPQTGSMPPLGGSPVTISLDSPEPAPTTKDSDKNKKEEVFVYIDDKPSQEKPFSPIPELKYLPMKEISEKLEEQEVKK